MLRYNSSGVQLCDAESDGRVWLNVDDLTDIDPKTRAPKKFTVALSQEDVEFIEAYSAYRNAMAKALKTPLRRQWARKNMAEYLLRLQIGAEKKQLGDMFDQVGPMPAVVRKANGEPDDEATLEAMLPYVKRVLAWNKKLPSSK